MDAGLIPVVKPSGEAPAKSGQPANIAPAGQGPRDGFSQHLQGSHTAAPAQPVAASTNGEPVFLNGQMIGEQKASLSQPSALLSETLMQQLQLAGSKSTDGIANGLVAEPLAPLDLKKLGQQFDNLDQLLEENPSLAFITGHLELLSPQDIPSIVTNSPLIQQALSAEDLQKFMHTPQPLGKLMDDLQLPQPVKQLVASAGIGLDRTATPRQLLAAVGVDPGIVSAELQMLKDNVQLEGLSPYMLRAAKLGGQHKPQSSDNKATKVEPSAPDQITGDAVVPLTPVMAKQADQQVVTNRPDQIPVLSKMERKGSEHTPALESRPEPAMASNFPDAQIERVAFDPTQQLTRQMEQLSPKNKIAFGSQSANVDPMIASIQAPDPQTRGIEPGVTEALAIQPAAATSKTPAATLDTQMTMEKLMASQILGQPQGSASGFGSEGQDASFDQGGQPDSTLITQVGLAEPSGLTTASKSTGDFTDILNQTQVQPDAVRKAVIDKAQMLVNDGGGSIKLEFGGGDQRVELAMQVENDSVSLKIMAGSEKLKDLIASDMPKLREAMNLHNLELREVELGSQTRRDWSQGSFDQGAFQREFAEQKQSTSQSSGKIVKTAKSAYGSISAINPMTAVRARHHGQIQVFA